ncbi:MAG: MOSC domain-containing protein [Gemmatimonadaceae bacterium]|nr:MOSC domain-containing protein [Gemmatimonadaceae bacterium]
MPGGGPSVNLVIGEVEAIFRYPIKSMGGERVESAEVGWHGLEGDRRLALRRTKAQNGFPWLTATKMPELLLFSPLRHPDGADGELPARVRTPEGNEFAVFSEELAADVENRHSEPVEMTHLRHGIFDDACISVITSDTIREVGRLAGLQLDVRRFRPNILIRLSETSTFAENDWLGGQLSFGDASGPRVSLTMLDDRCAMVNYDPHSARAAPDVLKSIVRANDNKAGIYGSVVRTGRVEVGQSIRLKR